MRALIITLSVIIVVVIVGLGVFYFTQTGNTNNLSNYQPSLSNTYDNGTLSPTTSTDVGTTSMTSTSETSTTTTSQDIVGVASQTSDLKTFVAAVNEAGLGDMLKTGGPYTIFAPTDMAFGKLDQDTIKKLTTDKNFLISVLRNHIVNGTYKTSDMLAGGQLRLSSGNEIAVTVNGSSIMIGDAKIVEPDMVATNGIIQGIDQVIIP